jgi:hypothetical protein
MHAKTLFLVLLKLCYVYILTLAPYMSQANRKAVQLLLRESNLSNVIMCRVDVNHVTRNFKI